MGILDDAIRQHLDLKRRQGAEEDELQRLEDEAFGPPSRPGEPDFPGATEDEAAEPPPATGESVAVEEPEALAGEPPTPAPEPSTAQAEPSTLEPLAPETGEEPVAAPPPDQQSIESLDTVEHPFEGAIEDTGEAEVIEEPLPGEAPAPEPAPSTPDLPPTGEEEVVEGELAESEGEGEDVLEETPEFLRDQPEDDELWFEQGEPKDFDF
jgi:hypothetical protein